MKIRTTISFAIQPFEGTHALTALLDGTSLVEQVTSFEREMGFDVVGGYGGLIPQWFNYGSLNRYFLGDFGPDSYFAKKGGIYLLGCDCGEVGCWPLSARIETGNDIVRWVDFRQEHRPERDYSGFGPFAFDKDQYKQAVAVLCDEFSAFSSEGCS